jgi:hypothetical protein
MADGGEVVGERREAERGHVSSGARGWVEAFDPATPAEQGFRRGDMPGLWRDAADVELDAVIEPVAASMSQFAPGADGQLEVRIVMKWSPESLSLVRMELKMIRKSSGWCR